MNRHARRTVGTSKAQNPRDHTIATPNVQRPIASDGRQSGNEGCRQANPKAALTPTLTVGLACSGRIGSGLSDHGIRASLAMKF